MIFHIHYSTKKSLKKIILFCFLIDVFLFLSDTLGLLRSCSSGQCNCIIQLLEAQKLMSEVLLMISSEAALRHQVSFSYAFTVIWSVLILFVRTTNWRGAGFFSALCLSSVHRTKLFNHTLQNMVWRDGLWQANLLPKCECSLQERTTCTSNMSLDNCNLMCWRWSWIVERLKVRVWTERMGKPHLTVSISGAIIFTNLRQKQTGTTMPCCLRYCSPHIISNNLGWY